MPELDSAYQAWLCGQCGSEIDEDIMRCHECKVSYLADGTPITEEGDDA